MAMSALAVSPVRAQSAENVAVVINDNSAVSALIGEHYARVRALPGSNVVRIRTVAQETIDRAAFVRTIQEPIAAAIARQGLQDRILYLVLTKGIPLRITGTAGPSGTGSSVDSELTLLYRRMTGSVVPSDGRVDNPYFLGAREVSEARRFTHREQDVYLVSRLDAFTPDEAIELIDRGRAPAHEGRVVLHQSGSFANTQGDGWLAAAARRLEAQGESARVLFDTPKNAPPGAAPVLGYYSWGSIDPQLRSRQTGIRFTPGALAATFVGSGARTFNSPPENWVPSNIPSRAAAFAGSSQSLVGDLIRQGTTGAAGYVADPYLQSAIRPDILFPAYFAGFNLVEAFYLAMPHLGWQAIVIGDPLCAPFERERLTPAEVEGGVDEATELPAFFSTRRLEVAGVAFAAAPVVARLLVRAEARRIRGDTAGARKALEEASAAAPTLAAPPLQLALFDELAGDYEAATKRYRRVLELQPRNAVALNNLAYNLAVHGKAPQEAKPLAEKAVALTKNNPTIIDTLGWIEYLLGNHATASRLLADAVRRAPINADIRLHAAFALAATRDTAAAAIHLTEALRLDPDLAMRSDVAELRAQLSAPVR